MGCSLQDTLYNLKKIINIINDKQNKTLVTTGASMGGYGAILYGCLLKAKLAVCAGVETQLLIKGGITADKLKNKFSSKSIALFNQNFTKILSNSSTQCFIYYGDNCYSDVFCGLKINHFSKINIISLKNLKHPVSIYINAQYGWGNFINHHITNNCDFPFQNNEISELVKYPEIAELLYRVNCFNLKKVEIEKIISILNNYVGKVSNYLCSHIYNSLSLLYSQLHEFNLAYDLQRKAVALNQNNIVFNLRLALLCLNRNQNHEVIAVCDNIIDIHNPKIGLVCWEGFIFKAKMLRIIGKHSESLAILEKLTQYELPIPYLAKVYSEIYYLYYDNHLRDKRIISLIDKCNKQHLNCPELKQYLELELEKTNIAQSISQAKRETGQVSNLNLTQKFPISLELEKTEKLVQSDSGTIEIELEYTSALMKLAEFYESQEKWSETVDCYQKVIKLNSENQIAYLKLAKVLQRQNDIHTAIASYQKAIALESNQPVWVYHCLGDLLNQTKQNQAAIDAFQKAIQIKPDHSVIHAKLAKALEINNGQEEVANMMLNSSFKEKSNNIVVESAKHKDENCKKFSIKFLVEKIQQNPNQETLYWELIKLVSRNKFNFIDSEINELKKLKVVNNNRILNSLVEYSICNVETRKSNYLWSAKYQYKIISLGSHCISRTIPTKWGIKSPKSMGELTHPFDLSVHPYDTICQLINNDFQDYLNPVFFKQDNNNIPIHTKYKITFNHEGGNHFLQNNYSKLVKKYEMRIKNFYHDIERFPILFIHANLPHENIIPSKLAQILQHKFIDVPHKLLYLNTTQSSLNIDSSTLPNNLIVKHIPYPNKNYIWHDHRHYTSEEGLNFDLSIINTIKELITDYF